MGKEHDDSMGMFWLIMLGVGGLMCMFVLMMWTTARRARPAARVAMATVQVMTYQMAISNFNADVGRWPQSLNELESNSTKTVFIVGPSKDPWGRPFVYVPFNSATGFGRVISFGQDGKPGGTGLDADIEQRFP